MQETLINERRNWKAQVFPYDHFMPDDSRECNYCLTDKQAEILRGIIEPLGWTTRWWSDSDTPIDRDAIEAFRDDLIRRLMMSCCGDEVPVQYRYTNDGVLQRSEDGGATWQDAPEYDPRNYSPQFPPMSGSDGFDKRCVAATGAVALIKEQVGDQLTDDMSRYTLSQLITDWVKTYLETSNPFLTLLTVIANQIFALIISVLRPTLTDTVYDTLKCILYCHIASDASFNDSQWQAVRDDITSQIGGIAGIFFEHLVYLLGAGGLTNVARAGGAASGDCSTCTDCLICAQLWSVFGAGHGVIDSVDPDNGQITAHGTDPGNGNYYLIIKTPTADDCCVVPMIEALSGGWTLTGWTDCGQPQVEGVPQHTGIFGGDVCVNYLQLQSATPFQARITFASCP